MAKFNIVHGILVGRNQIQQTSVVAVCSVTFKGFVKARPHFKSSTAIQTKVGHLHTTARSFKEFLQGRDLSFIGLPIGLFLDSCFGVPKGTQKIFFANICIKISASANCHPKYICKEPESTETTPAKSD